MELNNISQNALAKAVGAAPRRINEIVNQRRSITPDSALRLAKFFDTTPEFWIEMQAKYDLEVAREKIQDKIDKEVKTLKYFRDKENG